MKNGTSTGIFLFLGTLFCISAQLPAQSMYWGNTASTANMISTQSVVSTQSNQPVFMEQIADNLYKTPKSGVVYYKIDGENFRLCYEENASADRILGNIRRTNDRTLYLRDGNIVGYYVPGEEVHRYYIASSEGEQILKEEQIGVLYNGKLYADESAEQIRYTVDESFDKEVIGMFLFFQ